MNIGVSTACLYPMPTEEALKTVGENGASCTEIFFNAESELKPPFVKMLAELARQYDLPIVSIHPTNSLAESFMLFSNYERRLQIGLDEFRRYGEIAAELGAEYVILHGGKDNGILNEEQYCERYMRVAEAVRSGGAMLLHENVRGFRAGQLDFLKMMQKNLGEQVGFCLDVKQCIRNGYTAFDMIDAVGKNIRHLHISDHTAERDCLLPGNGNFDFEGLFSRMQDLHYQGNAVIEVYNNAYDNYSQIFAACEKIKT
ncbi:MAG: sugar phosphate isomerase/epimerase [Clostridia bacterium]|nr:sugar phosphate isomerase/epimerase [Clostridia bacterium]